MRCYLMLKTVQQIGATDMQTWRPLAMPSVSNRSGAEAELRRRPRGGGRRVAWPLAPTIASQSHQFAAVFSVPKSVRTYASQAHGHACKCYIHSIHIVTRAYIFEYQNCGRFLVPKTAPRIDATGVQIGWPLAMPSAPNRCGAEPDLRRRPHSGGRRAAWQCASTVASKSHQFAAQFSAPKPVGTCASRRSFQARAARV